MEDLVNQVRDDSSRTQFREATRAYEAAAFRAAVISTWVAVALDLVSKLRQLADDGDANAGVQISNLDTAIGAQDKRGLQNFESGLLDRCKDDFELINARDHLALTRLYEDRNVCAHPAFVDPEEVFAPTAELVRAHLATAVDAVLRHPPTPGKQAIQRFIAESQGSSWPSSREALVGYLRERYFERGKDSMRRSLAELFVKGALGIGSPSSLVSSRSAHCARALEDIDPSLLSAALSKVIRAREEGVGLTDGEILLMIGGLGGLAPVWDVVPTTSIPRIVSCIATATWAELATAGALRFISPEPEIANALAARIQGATVADITQAVGLRPSASLVDRALLDLISSPSWRSAEERMRTELLPLARYLTSEHLGQLLHALTANSDVRMAAGMPQLLDELFEETKDNPEAVAAWKEIGSFLSSNGRDGDLTDWYAYPGLVAKTTAL